GQGGQRYHGPKSRSEKITLPRPHMVEQGEEIVDEGSVRDTAQVGAVISAWQIVGDAAERTRQQSRRQDERLATVHQAVDEQQRRPFAPGEVAAAITAGGANFLRRLARQAIENARQGEGLTRPMRSTKSGTAQAAS